MIHFFNLKKKLEDFFCHHVHSPYKKLYIVGTFELGVGFTLSLAERLVAGLIYILIIPHSIPHTLFLLFFGFAKKGSTLTL
jgi:hypothetical protein